MEVLFIYLSLLIYSYSSDEELSCCAQKELMSSETPEGSNELEPIQLPRNISECPPEFVGIETDIPEDRNETESWFGKFWRWVPTSESLLEDAERKVLSYIKTEYVGRYIDIAPTETHSECKLFSSFSKPEDRRIWTLTFNPEAETTPLLLIHGLCAAVGLWALNIDALARDRTVYAIDVLGFGRSSRPTFASNASEVEHQYVEAIEAWRKEMKLEKFILLGHSMGGFLSTAYSLKYPDRVVHLVLADPWGFPEKPEDVSNLVPATSSKFRINLITTLGQSVNPLGVLRAAGPFGPGLIARARPDLVLKFSALNQNGTADIADYLYHANAQNPSGEEAFRTMMVFLAWAKNAMENRIHELKSSLPLTMIYGGKTWIPHISEERLKHLRPEHSPTSVHIIPDAGHHVYADNQPQFNSIVNSIGKLIDASNYQDCTCDEFI